jgi:AbrB family looped-hinge helix DNA binding protein
MRATIDAAGRVLVPKALRDSLGLVPGAQVDISEYGAGLQLLPTAAPPELERNRHGRLVASSTAVVTDDAIRETLDQIRR